MRYTFRFANYSLYVQYIDVYIRKIGIAYVTTESLNFIKLFSTGVEPGSVESLTNTNTNEGKETWTQYFHERYIIIFTLFTILNIRDTFLGD